MVSKKQLYSHVINQKSNKTDDQTKPDLPNFILYLLVQ